MTRMNENARREPGGNTSITYAAKDTATGIGQFFAMRVRCWLCRKLCRDEFFNRDASIEIDRLVLENERLRAGGTR